MRCILPLVALYQVLTVTQAFAPNIPMQPSASTSTSTSTSASIINTATPSPTELHARPPKKQFHEMTESEKSEAMQKATKAMTSFSNTYIKNTSTSYCSDLSIPAVVIKGLAKHKVELGKPLCPCRYYEDKEKEAKDGFWNCPCVPMRERHECHCMLFVTEDNAFVGEEKQISYEEVVERCGGLE